MLRLCEASEAVGQFVRGGSSGKPCWGDAIKWGWILSSSAKPQQGI